jgi:hypothetical protein
MYAELRGINDMLVLHTDVNLVERKLRKLKSYIYTIPYYSSSDGTIIGVDMFFDKSARTVLRKLVDSNQLPLL